MLLNGGLNEKLGPINYSNENGEVFLLGLVNKDRAKQAIDIARNVGGVNRVYNIFEYQEK